MRLLLAALALAGALSLAHARDLGQYDGQPEDVRAWYHNAQLTDAARARFGFKNCCDHSDVVKTRFKVDRASGGDAWYWLNADQWQRVPDDIIHWGEHAPGGEPTLFAIGGHETCFYPGRDGN